jgi:ribosomal subunit interface protein
MMISTSSYDVQLTDEVCRYVESTLCRELEHVAAHVVSADVRLETINSAHGRCDIKAIVRVDLCDCQVIVAENRADNLYTAVRHGALETARNIGRQLQQSRQASGTWIPQEFRAVGSSMASEV